MPHINLSVLLKNDAITKQNHFLIRFSLKYTPKTPSCSMGTTYPAEISGLRLKGLIDGVTGTYVSFSFFVSGSTVSLPDLARR